MAIWSISMKFLRFYFSITFRFQILQLQMNDYRYHYMFTTFVCISPFVLNMARWSFYDNVGSRIQLSNPYICFPIRLLTQDIESFDLEDFKYNSVNITAFRLVDVNNKRVTETMDQVNKVQKNSGRDLMNVSSIMQVIFHHDFRWWFWIK